MELFEFTEIELYLFSEWAKDATEGQTGQVMGYWLTKYDDKIMVQPLLNEVRVEGTLEL